MIIENIILDFKIKKIKEIPDYQDFLISYWDDLDDKIKKAFPEMERGKKIGLWDLKN
jgi:hypothetical protein